METVMKVAEVLFYGVVAYFISTIIHELGHVVCGLMNKWKFLLFVVGPFKLYREDLNSKIRFGIEKDVTLWGGCGGTLPDQKAEGNIDVFAKVLLAGPVASFIFGIIILSIFAFVKADLFFVIGLVAIAEGVVCILPMNIKTGILYNDGTRFRRITKHGSEREEERALLEIIIKGMTEGEDALYDEESLNILRSSSDTDYKYYGLFYDYLNSKKSNYEERMIAIRQEAEDLKQKASKYTIMVCAMD